MPPLGAIRDMSAGVATWIAFPPWDLAGGNLINIELKVRKVLDGTCLWELRRITPIFVRRDASDTYMGKLLKRDLLPWSDWALSLYGDKLYYESERAASSTHSRGYAEQDGELVGSV